MRTLSAELDYQTVLQSVISVASKLTNSEVASILKYEEADGHLHFLAAPWFQKDSILKTYYLRSNNTFFSYSNLYI